MPTTAPPARPPRSAASFYLVALPILVALVAFLLFRRPDLWVPYLGSGEQKAVALIDDLGGQVYRRDEQPSGPVIGVSLKAKQVTNADLERLRGLPDLEWLDLSITNLDGQGLAVLAGPSSLRALALEHAKVSRKDLQSLVEMPHLQRLDLSVAGIAGDARGWHVLLDDETLFGVEHLVHLHMLRLTRTNVSDAGLAHLAGLADLEELDLGMTQVHGPGLQQLQGLQRLARLDLYHCQLDGGLHALARFPKLRTLNLKGSALAKTAQAELAQLGNLQELILSGPDMPELRQALTKTRIVFTSDD